MMIKYEVYAEDLCCGGDSELVETFDDKRDAQLFIESSELDDELDNNNNVAYWIEERVINE